MKIIIIGAVAAGTSAGAKARRNDEDAKITIYEKDKYISYSGCGMPYYIGRLVEDIKELTPRDPDFFKSKYNIDIHTGHEVIGIDTAKKQVKVKNLMTGDIFFDGYDILILATGAKAIVPDIQGINNKNVFFLRNINDMKRIHEYIKDNNPKSTLIIGAGYVGLEMCENLKELGLDVTIVEKSSQVAPGLDPEMAVLVEDHIKSKDVQVLTNTKVDMIDDKSVHLSDGRVVYADMTIASVGVIPETSLARSAGIKLGITGAILVDSRMRTSVSDIYACGDCIEHFNLISGKPVYRPLGSTANKTGRIAGDCVTGGDLEFGGILGTGIFKIFDITVAQTGLTQQDASWHGFDVVSSNIIKPDKPEYFGGKELNIKVLADKATGRLLGAQVVGEEGADKRIDVFVTAITFGAKAKDLFHLDLAYAPPYSTTKDPVMYAGMVLDNVLSRQRELISPKELFELMHSGEKYNLIDTRAPEQYNKGHIETAVNMPLEKLRSNMDMLDKNIITITYCNKGVTGNAAQNVLLNKGFKKVYSISGGYKTYTRWLATNK